MIWGDGGGCGSKCSGQVTVGHSAGRGRYSTGRGCCFFLDLKGWVEPTGQDACPARLPAGLSLPTGSLGGPAYLTGNDGFPSRPPTGGQWPAFQTGNAGSPGRLTGGGHWPAYLTGNAGSPGRLIGGHWPAYLTGNAGSPGRLIGRSLASISDRQCWLSRQAHWGGSLTSISDRQCWLSGQAHWEGGGSLASISDGQCWLSKLAATGDVSGQSGGGSHTCGCDALG